MRLLPAGVLAAALAAMIACGAFSSDDAPGPGGDAGPAGSEAGVDEGAAPDAAPPDGDALDGGAPACPVLAPVIIGDGGEDAHCGPGGSEVVLASSNLSCGSCGHACAGGLQCVNGMCALPDVMTTRGGGTVISGGVATGLFVSSDDPGCEQDGGADLSLISTGAGPATAIASATGECYAHADVVDGELFLATSRGIRHGALSTFGSGVIVPGTPPTATVTATRKTLFWVITSIPTLWYMPRTGSVPVKLSSATNFIPHRIISDGDAAYWAVNDEQAPAGANLYRRADTGDVEKRFSGLPTVVSIALDHDYVYLGTVDGQILRAPKTGPGVVEPVAAIVGARMNLVGLAVDDAWVYAIGSESPFPSEVSVEIWRAPKCGGRASKIGYFSQATVDRLVDLGDRLALPNIGKNAAVHFLGK